MQRGWIYLVYGAYRDRLTPLMALYTRIQQHLSWRRKVSSHLTWYQLKLKHDFQNHIQFNLFFSKSWLRLEMLKNQKFLWEMWLDEEAGIGNTLISVHWASKPDCWNRNCCSGEEVASSAYPSPFLLIGTSINDLMIAAFAILVMVHTPKRLPFAKNMKEKGLAWRYFRPLALWQRNSGATRVF